MAYRIAIADDNSTDIEYIASIVKAWGNAQSIPVETGAFSSAEAFLFTYSEDKTWDILLLDIEMGGINGVELAKELRRSGSSIQIIFITGFPDFMAEGYEVSALHYLLKPVSGEKLRDVLDRAAANLAKSEKRLCVTFNRQTDFVPLSRILYMESQKQYVLIHTSDETYRMKSSLAELEAGLDEYFFKCQRSFLVNLRYITRIKNDCVVLKGGEEVPISRGMADRIGREIIRLF